MKTSKWQTGNERTLQNDRDLNNILKIVKKRQFITQVSVVLYSSKFKFNTKLSIVLCSYKFTFHTIVEFPLIGHHVKCCTELLPWGSGQDAYKVKSSKRESMMAIAGHGLLLDSLKKCFIHSFLMTKTNIKNT